MVYLIRRKWIIFRHLRREGNKLKPKSSERLSKTSEETRKIKGKNCTLRMVIHSKIIFYMLLWMETLIFFFFRVTNRNILFRLPLEFSQNKMFRYCSSFRFSSGAKSYFCHMCWHGTVSTSTLLHNGNIFLFVSLISFSIHFFNI